MLPLSRISRRNLAISLIQGALQGIAPPAQPTAVGGGGAKKYKSRRKRRARQADWRAGGVSNIRLNTQYRRYMILSYLF